MAHDVFISYSSEDKTVADAAVARLESSGIRCWIAPRDILPGTDWTESLMKAIEGARVMVLVLSATANDSEHVRREVQGAVHCGLSIIPLRIEHISPNRALSYFLSTPHWLDAYTPPMEKHLSYLADVVTRLLRGPEDEPPSRTIPGARSRSSGSMRRWWVVAVIAALIAAGVMAWRWKEVEVVTPTSQPAERKDKLAITQPPPEIEEPATTETPIEPKPIPVTVPATRATSDSSRDDAQLSQEVSGVKFLVTSVRREGATYVIELSARALKDDVTVMVRTNECAITLPSGRSVKADYIRVGDDKGGKVSRGKFLTDFDSSMTVKFVVPDQVLESLPRVELKLVLAGRSQTLRYQMLPVN